VTELEETMEEGGIPPTSPSERTVPVRRSEHQGGRKQNEPRSKKQRQKPVPEKPSPPPGEPKGGKVDVRV
jgi:hypothetical protein